MEMILFRKRSLILLIFVVFLFPGQVLADKRNSVALVMKSLTSPFFSTSRPTLPPRLRPAPLNLLVRSLSDELDQDEMRLDTFEFLACDAYCHGRFRPRCRQPTAP